MESFKSSSPSHGDFHTSSWNNVGCSAINNGAISGSLFVDIEANGVQDETDTPLGGEFVYIDQNQNGVPDQHRFRASRLVLKPIPDDAQTRFLMHVPEFDPIADVNVVVDIEHAYLSDLAMALVSPSGTRVELFLSEDLAGSNPDVIRFDDEADQSIRDVILPYAENVRPATGRLSDFTGELPGGDWYLEIYDSTEGHLGQVNGWHLEFTTGDYVTHTNSAGEYGFDHLPMNPGEVHPQPLHAWSRVDVGISEEGYIFGVVQDGGIKGTVFHDSNVDAVRDREPGVSARTVYLDHNGNGRRDIQQIVSINNDMQPIMDFHSTKSEIHLAGLEGQILDVNARLTIRHTWNDDLDVFLISPAGTRVELFTDIGGSRDNFLGTTLDDEAEEYITDNFLSYALTFQPEGVLADFDGENPNGTWQLVIADDESWDKGVLEAWSIDITYGEPSAVTDDEGKYLFGSLLAEHEYQVELLDQPGWSPTTPSINTSVLLKNGQFIAGHDVGTAQQQEIGDFDRDGRLGCSDIDQLAADITTSRHQVQFDMTLDGKVDELDLDTWLVRAGHVSLPVGEVFHRGDANLDGKINARDLNAVGLNWHRVVRGWCLGDFTLDGTVDASDLNVLAINWEQDVSDEPANVAQERAPRAPLTSKVEAMTPVRDVLSPRIAERVKTEQARRLHRSGQAVRRRSQRGLVTSNQWLPLGCHEKQETVLGALSHA